MLENRYERKIGVGQVGNPKLPTRKLRTVCSLKNEVSVDPEYEEKTAAGTRNNNEKRYQ